MLKENTAIMFGVQKNENVILRQIVNTKPSLYIYTTFCNFSFTSTFL